MNARPPDLGRFLQRIASAAPRGGGAVLAGFDPSAPAALARAPGRLDVMGGIADYSGSLVLQLPIAEAAHAAAQWADDGRVIAVSLPAEPGGTLRRCCLEIESWRSCAADPKAAEAWFAADPASRWAAYVLGPVMLWAAERGVAVERGLRLVLASDVPEGKGVSSSAAIEVASLVAVARLVGAEIDGADVARLCQAAENHLVGAACGIMDQMTAAFGRADHLLALLCQPAMIQGFIPVPPAIRFWGIDSGIRHAVSGSDYRDVRCGAFIGYRMIAELAGFSAGRPDASGRVRIDDARWGGYLANIAPEEFDERFAWRLPETVSGAAFLAQYGGTTDRATRVDPERRYAVRQPTRHPIEEHRRVQRFAELLSGPLGETELRTMGELMYASHASYSACGLGSDGTDLLVEMVRAAGPAAGLYGAKITGGGSGGTVAVLGRAEAAPAVAEIAADYARQTGRTNRVFADSSDGATA